MIKSILLVVFTVSLEPGTKVDPNNGSLTLSSAGDLSYSAALGSAEPVSFVYRVTQFDGEIATATVSIGVSANNALFDIDKRAHTDEVSIGDLVRYSISVSPRQAYTLAANVELNDQLPPGLDLIEDTLRLVAINNTQRSEAEPKLNLAGTSARQLRVAWQAQPETEYQLSYVARVNAGATSGEKVNLAQMSNASGTPISKSR